MHDRRSPSGVQLNKGKRKRRRKGGTEGWIEDKDETD